MFLWEIAAMKCPFCNIEMISGYLNCGELLWSTKKHKIRYEIIAERNVMILSLLFSYFI